MADILEPAASPKAHLLVSGFIYINVFALTAIHTPRNATGIRLASVVPLAALTRWIHLTTNEILSPIQQRVAGPLIWHNYLSILELLLLSRVDVQDLMLLGRNTWWQAVCLTVNARRIGTKWEIRGIQRAKSPQGRVGFVLRSLMIAIAANSIVDVMTRLPPAPEPHLLLPGKETLYEFWNLSAEDVTFRLITVIMFAFITFLSILFMYYSMAALGVATGINTPEAWPPIFGSLSSGYTVSRVWSHCWHQGLRKVVGGFGGFISDNILLLPRGTVLSQFTRVFLAFSISAGLHHVMEAGGTTISVKVDVLTFFLLQPFGILIEQVVQSVAGQSLPMPVRRTIGYVWVITWFWWSMGLFCYEQLRIDIGKDLAPIPVVHLAQRWFGSAEA